MFISPGACADPFSVRFAVAGLDDADAESAALIRAMLMQDQLNAAGVYDDDDYGNAYAAEPKRGRAPKKAVEEEMDDDFVPLAVQRELKLRGLVTGPSAFHY
jgi:hypothetical protein